MSAYFVKSTAVTLVLVITCYIELFRAQGDDNDGEWVQLCTLTSNGSSQFNVTMPCGIHVEDKPNNVGNTSANNEDIAKEWVKTVENGSGSESDLGNDRKNTNENNDNWLPPESFVGDDYTRQTAENDYVDEHDDEVAVEAAEDYFVDDYNDGGAKSDDSDDGGGGEQEEHKNRQQGTINKVLLTYLMDAKNQLYNKILYLLNVLKNAFLNARLNRRNRRELIKRRIKLNANEKQQEELKKHSVSSTFMEPTFERSMMTMSFLVFGLFIIQVVQRLMQTMQHFGEVKSMANSVADYLPTVSF